MLRLITVLMLFVAPAGAQTYSLTPEGCADAFNDGALRVGNGVLHFHESMCTRTSDKRPVGDGWYEAEWTCEGEGEVWTRQLSPRIASDRVQLRDEHGTAEFLACP